jgi:hypothetical protein
LTSSPPPSTAVGASVSLPTSPATSSASAGWLNGSTQVAREAAEKFDREHSMAPLSPITVEPLDGSAPSKPKKKRAKATVDVPPPLPQRGKSETPTNAKATAAKRW